jgi:type III secretory pathway component EscR
MGQHMNNITTLFADVSTESFNKIDDEALGQLGSEIERIRSVQEQIELTEVKIKKLKEEEQVLADSITALLQSKGVSEIKKLHIIGCVIKVMVI